MPKTSNSQNASKTQKSAKKKDKSLQRHLEPQKETEIREANSPQAQIHKTPHRAAPSKTASPPSNKTDYTD